MQLICFTNIFPKIAETETRFIYVLEEVDIPVGKYYFLEMYCPDNDCDCRKVDIIVYGEDKKVHANLTFGWEDQAYYTQHFGFEYSELPGPDFSPMQFNGPFAKFFWMHFPFIVPAICSMWIGSKDTIK